MRTKTKPNRLGLYDDIRQVLDAAMQSGGGSFELPTYGMAVHWRQRAYQFRKLYAETLASDDSFSMSPYDRLTMPRIEPDSTTVVIKLREAVGTFTPNRESYVPVDIPVPGDELFDVAADIAKRIKEKKL